MAAIKMQPLVVDMGGSTERKFASDADYLKVAAAPMIKIVNSNWDGDNLIYHAISSLNNVPEDIFPGEEGASGLLYFVNGQGTAKDGSFAGALFVVVYGVLVGSKYEYKIFVTEY